MAPASAPGWSVRATRLLDAHAEHELLQRDGKSARAVVAEQGTHEALLGQDGIYAELFALHAAAYG